MSLRIVAPEPKARAQYGELVLALVLQSEGRWHVNRNDETERKFAGGFSGCIEIFKMARGSLDNNGIFQTANIWNKFWSTNWKVLYSVDPTWIFSQAYGRNFSFKETTYAQTEY